MKMHGVPQISTNSTVKISDANRDAQLIKSLQLGFDTQNERALEQVAYPRDMAAHCDCEELNRALGLVRTQMSDRNNTDDAWSLQPTELNELGNCKHCNYVPVYRKRGE
jgi:hypothetical protein